MAINFPDSPSVNDTHTVGDRTWKWDGNVWNIVVGTTSDHGNLAGLSDDDHTQYLRTDGTRTAASLTVSGAVTVDTDTFVVDNVNDRIGIGTTSPSHELDVNGDINATGDVRTNGYATGLHFVKSQTISGTPTSVTITDCFSTEFRNYRIICDDIRGASTYVYMQLGNSTGATSGYYGHWTSYTYNVNGPLSETAHNNVGPLPVAYMLSGGANYTGLQVDIYGPRTSNRTKWSSTPTGIRGVLANGLVDNSTNYTSVTFYVTSGTISTGTFRVYGYNNG